MRIFVALAAINGFIAVAAGAFGAHGLRGRLDERSLEIFETGARYHMFGALALIGVAWLVARELPLARGAGWSFTAGIALFSGSLYALALSGIKTFGAVTPAGGLAFLAGWLLMAIGAVRAK